MVLSLAGFGCETKDIEVDKLENIKSGYTLDTVNPTIDHESVLRDATVVSSTQIPVIVSSSPPLFPSPELPAKKEMWAYVTGYTPESSCKLSASNPDCKMASGEVVYEGAVACPYSLSYGTKVKIGESVYTCADRYARWLDSSRGAPTFDIFTYGTPHPKTYEKVIIFK